MDKKNEKGLVIEFVNSFFIGFLVVICTFPSNEWTYSIGIDAPLSWAYNFLFENGLAMGKHIIFPHGPLAFFMYPLPENILLSTLVLSLLKVMLVFNLTLLLSRHTNQTKWILAFVLAYFISIIAGFNHLILANLILIYCNAFYFEKRKLRFIAYFLTAFAFYVKAYVAIISGVIFISFISYNLFLDKRIKTFLFDCLSLLSAIVLFWIVMYGSVSGILKYFWGMFHLAQDNSSAAAYYPYNNWFILGLFILALFLLIPLNRTAKFMFYSVLTGLSLFAAWKHGMARQDISHVKGFYVYFIICSIILLVFYKKNTFVNFAIIVFAYIMFSISLTNSVNYQSLQYEIIRTNNFIQFITEFDDLKRKSEKISQREISINKLPKNILDSIGNSTIDVYPWDYSIIAANNLNWQPRVVINSYASYTSWLDEQNSNHFASEDAPNYIIWELKKVGSNLNGSNFNSIDDRYLLNDEPKTIIELLKQYDYWFSNDRFLLLRKKKEALDMTLNTSPKEVLTWAEWQNVPKLNDGQLLRVKIDFKKSLLQSLKSFLYKDEQFWIYLRLNDNSIHKYRIVPKNASDGLWINPYIYNSDKELFVKDIMFKASNENILKEKIIVIWETFDFSNPNIITNFFAVNDNIIDSTVFQTTNDFEENKEKYWSEISNDLISTDAFEGTNSFLLKPGMFSCTFSYSLDSISINNMRIEADCWGKAVDYNKSNDISLVISVDSDKGNIVWKGIPIDRQFVDCREWNHIYNFVNYENLNPDCVLNGYLWNTSNKEILIDNFRIRITTNLP